MVRRFLSARACRLLVLVVAVLFTAASARASAPAGPYQVEVRTDPAIVPVGRAEILVTVTASGQPVQGAEVQVRAQMPSMPMGERFEAAVPVAGAPGEYRAPARFGMAGAYAAAVTIRGPQGEARAVLPLSTGQDTSDHASTRTFGGIAWLSLALAVLALLAGVWLTRRHRARREERAGFERRPGKVQWLPILLSALLLVAAVVGATVMVRKLRKPSQMTVLQSESMNMSAMQAPPGAAPVVVKIVRRGRVEERVTYTGSVVPREEQDVAARVSGYLRDLKVYPGDRVHRGQVVAVVAAHELDTRVQEDQSALQVAQQEITVAHHGIHHAGAMLSQAHDEVRAAKATRASAQADLDYQAADYRREEALYHQGAISLDELQVSERQYRTARARVRNTGEEVAAAEANAHVVEAHAGSAQAEFEAAQARADEAQARLATARTFQGYQVVRSDLDGVVTQRLVALGTLVSPESVIFKISAIDPIRIQAAVAEPDVTGIHAGSDVSIRTQRHPGAVNSRVTAVFPTSDPTTRTAIVEALTPNPDGRFLPGDYVTVSVEREIGGLNPWVPADAVVPPDARGRTSAWVARGAAGALQAHRVFVKVGVSDGTRTEIRSGVRAGERVITQGWLYLHEGDAVSPTTWGVAGPEVLPSGPRTPSMPGMSMPGMPMPAASGSTGGKR